VISIQLGLLHEKATSAIFLPIGEPAAIELEQLVVA
jgi:hypothetical protein